MALVVYVCPEEKKNVETSIKETAMADYVYTVVFTGYCTYSNEVNSLKLAPPHPSPEYLIAWRQTLIIIS